MKINPGWRSFGQERTITDQTAKQVQPRSFADVMHQQDRERSREELQQKLKDIHLQGERLARSMTVRELKLYREMVRRFLEDTVRRGIGLKEVRGVDRRGRVKRYKLLDEINESLTEMAGNLLESEQGRIELLHKIGEIRGMLINLVF